MTGMMEEWKNGRMDGWMDGWIAGLLKSKQNEPGAAHPQTASATETARGLQNTNSLR